MKRLEQPAAPSSGRDRSGRYRAPIAADERRRRFFDAAGDFDRLISPGSPALGLLGEVDPHGETCLSAGQMRQLVSEVELLLSRAMAGAEHRGLMRLRAMASRCAAEHGELVFVGD